MRQLFIILLILSFSKAYAQKIAPRPMTGDVKEQKAANSSVAIGPKTGINVSNGSFENDNINPKSRVRLRAGAFVEIRISDAFALQPEILYSAKGFERQPVTRFPMRPLPSPSNFRLDYFTVPIIVKYAFLTKGKFRIAGQAGPYLGFLLSSDVPASDITDSYSTLDVGGQLGVSAAYRIGPESLTLDIRAGLGFTDIDESDTRTNLRATNQVLPSATVGYAFSL